MIESVNNMYFTVDSLIEINNITTGSSNITLRKVNVKSTAFDKMYMGKDLVEHKLYQIIDQFIERKVTPINFYLILLYEIYLKANICFLLCKKGSGKLNALARIFPFIIYSKRYMLMNIFLNFQFSC